VGSIGFKENTKFLKARQFHCRGTSTGSDTPLIGRANSFHEKAGKCQGCSFIFSFFFLVSSFSKLFPLSQAASVATLPSALFVERLSPGASWVFLIQ
jgi:hypothetical protein